MAKRLKTAAEASKKFAARAGVAGEDYKAAVQVSGESWAAGAGGAQETYNAGVQGAITRGAYGKGVAKAGAGKYVEGATAKGGQRYTQGIQLGQKNYTAGIAGVLDTLATIVYPPRRPRGDLGNQARSAIVQTTLHAKRVGAA